MRVLNPTDTRSSVDFNGSVTRFQVRSWSLSDSAFLVRFSTSRSSSPEWTMVCGRLELHAGEPATVEGALAELPSGRRHRTLRVSGNRMAAIAMLPKSERVAS